MNTAKKLLVLTAVLSLAACGNGDPGKDAGSSMGEQDKEDEDPDSAEEREPEHVHTWVDATCTTARMCSECGEKDGHALGHTWIDPTCTEPKTCSVCGATTGKPLGHEMQSATTQVPATCSRCGYTEGEPLAEQMDWYLLLMVFPKTEGTYTDEDGQEKTVKYTMPDKELKLYEKCAQAVEKDLYDMSGGVIVPHVTFKVADAPLTTVFLRNDDNGTGWYMGTTEAQTLLHHNDIDLEEYDHVTVIADLDDMPCGYWGLTMRRFSQDTGYAFINNYTYESFSSYFFDDEYYWIAGPVIHEFLHFMEGWSEKREKPIKYNATGASIVDSGEALGYKPDEYYDFKDFYTDLINRGVPVAGGIDPAMWREPPHLYR